MRWLVCLALLVLVTTSRADDAVAPDATVAPVVPAEPPPPAVAEPVVLPEPSDPPGPPEDPPDAPSSTRASSRNFAGSMQLDYLATPRSAGATRAFTGSTMELSMKVAMDFGDHSTASVKVCFACHGFEVGMAYFDLRIADELAVRVGRFTPAFGSFPLRHDPANHLTSDKPLVYDMGRMVRFRDWNEGILPAPWVDTGVELSGAHFFGGHQLDYAAYAIGGPKGDSQATDFDYKQSRSGERYYVDNNAEPTLGARVALTLDLGASNLLALGASAMAGRYDPEAKLGFAIGGVDASLQVGRTFLRAEYLVRWTQIGLGDDPAAKFKFGPGADGTFADYTLRDGGYVELEHGIGRVTTIGRFDLLRRFGNVLAGSPLEARSHVRRYTAAAAIRLVRAVQLKTSIEYYDFAEFPDELALHLGFATPF